MTRTLTIGALVGMFVGCALSSDDKTACRSSDDCVDDRICDEGQCRDGACDGVCLVLCDGAGECGGAPPSDCESRCLAGDATDPVLVPTLGAARCRRLWDEVHDDCDDAACVLACADLCVRARDCELVDDAAACVEGCLARNETCAAAPPTDCISVPVDVLCYEDADAC
ncbi:MAG TPA: hypothetical protein VFG69_11965 [Nannocystaceae bacterium]|nr:hypothetical protein [Nannocystaceae bacterium]